MSAILRKLTLLLSFILLGVMFYELKYKDSSMAWKNFKKPQVAAYASLEKDEEILKELERQTTFSSHKLLDPSFLVKPNIFEPIE